MSETKTVVEVEQVVIGMDGEVFRSRAAKERLAYQKAHGGKTWARLGIARKDAALSPNKETDR